MRWSDYFIPTLKTIPKDIKSPTIKYLVKSGMLRILRKEYSFYLPLGVKLIQKVDNYIRDIITKHKGLELDYYLIMSSSVPSNERAKIKRQNMASFFSQIISSYKQLPLLFYQFSNWHDGNNIKDAGPRIELSIRFLEAFIVDSGTGIDFKKLELLNTIVEDILSYLGLDFYRISLLQDHGVLAHWIVCDNEEGEQEIALCTSCNTLLHPAQINNIFSLDAQRNLHELQLIETPGMVTVNDVCRFFNKNPQEILKTIILAADGIPLAVLLRGDVQLSLKKLKLFLGKKNIQLADENLVKEVTGAPIGFSGPIELKKEITIIGDYSILQMVNCVAGANREDYHFANANLNRDFKVEKFADLTQPYDDKVCPHCKGKTVLKRFNKVAELYSPFIAGKKPIIIDGEKGKAELLISYLKVYYASLIPCLIEAYESEQGMAWPLPITPFKAVILLLNPHLAEIRERGEELYIQLKKENIESLLDDRSIGVGSKFRDAELLGIPIQIILGKKYLENKQIELKHSQSGKIVEVSQEHLIDKIMELLKDYNPKKTS